MVVVNVVQEYVVRHTKVVVKLAINNVIKLTQTVHIAVV